MITAEELATAKIDKQPTVYYRVGNEGLTPQKPIKSQMWITLVGFFTKKEAQQAAKAVGWLAVDVTRLHGRFESKWCICGPHGQTLRKPEYWIERNSANGNTD